MKKKIVFGVLAVLVLIIAFFGMKFFGSAVSTPSGEFFYIKTGATYDDVKNELVEKKYIGSATWFNLASKALGYKNVKPGRYKLEKGMSIMKLVRKLRAGDQTPVNLVITKMRTKENLASRVGKLYECDSAAMMAFLNNNDSLQRFKLDTNTAMAAAMPLTYSINWNTTPGKIFAQLHKAYEIFWDPRRKQRASNLKLTPEQVVTLASIIEEETTKKTDKPNIASTYLNRIEKNMPLQADPTVKFAMKDFGLKRILNVHLKTESPYNTYINKGLPPGPICTPSAETIDAVLNAPKTEYLYFVANSNFDGTHIFTTNYDDHLKFAREYQKALTAWMKKKDSLDKSNAN